MKYTDTAKGKTDKAIDTVKTALEAELAKITIGTDKVESDARTAITTAIETAIATNTDTSNVVTVDGASALTNTETTTGVKAYVGGTLTVKSGSDETLWDSVTVKVEYGAEG